MAGSRDNTLTKQGRHEVADPKLIKTYRLIITAFGIFGSASILFYAGVYTTTGLREALLAAAIIFFALLTAPIIYHLVKRNHTTIAGVLILLVVLIAYGGNELVWEGLTAYHILGGLLLILIAGNFALSRKWLLWLITIYLYFLFIVVVNITQPLARVDISPYPALMVYAIGVNILLALAVFILFVWVTQRGSISRRLMYAFLLLVLIPIIATSAVANLLLRDSTEAQMYRQLESVATLKQAELKAWRESLEPNLYIAATHEGRQEQQWMLETLARDYPSTQVFYLDIYNRTVVRFEQTVEQGRIFNEIFLINPQGLVVLSTNPIFEGANIASFDYFQKGRESTYVSHPFPDPETGRYSIIAITPLIGPQGDTIALVAGRVNMDRLNEIMSQRAGLGGTGEAYLVSPDKVLLTNSRFEGFFPNEAIIDTTAIELAIDQKISGYGSYQDYRGIPVIGVYRWVPEIRMALVVEQDSSEAFQTMYTMFLANLGTAGITTLVAVFVSLLVTRRITVPLENLNKTAHRIAAGETYLAADVEQEDEIGALAKTFNNMTAQLRILIGSLEQRVIDRTKELERRSLQLRVASEVARDATGVRDMDDLLNRIVALIRDRFGYHHAGIFLVDETGDWATLRSATGEAGRKMLEHGHRLKIGETGLVGYVTSIGKPRVAHDVGADAVHFKNPLLPSTRSEVALPLKVGDRIIGALDVQSVDEAAFDEETVEVLQTMTDQVAIAIENVRLIHQMEQNVKELETAYGRYTVDSWEDFFMRSSNIRGFRFRGLYAEPVSDMSEESVEAWKNDSTVIRTLPSADNGSDQASTLAVPMRLRGQTVGVVNIKLKSPSVPHETVGLLEDIATRLSLALDNVRLLEESQLRSEQINLLQEITAAGAANINLRDLLQAVAVKIRTGFQLSYCSIIMFEADKKAGYVIIDDANPSYGSPMVGELIPVQANEAIQEVIHSSRSNAHYDLENNPCTLLMRHFLQPRKTAVLVLVPLLSRGDVIGIITMETNDRKRRFDEDDLRLTDQISLQVSTALDVTRLFEQTELRAERERLISQVTTKIRATLNIDTVMKTAALEMRRSFNLKEAEVRVSVGLNRYGELSSSNQAGYSHTEIGYLCTEDDRITPLIEVSGLDIIPALGTEGSGLHSNGNLVLPIKIRDQIIGVVRFTKAENEKSWKDDDISFLAALTDQLATALESARLYEDTQRRAERERLISEITSKVRASTNLDVIMQTAVQELAEALQIPRGSILLRSGDGGSSHD
jgi:GAF domain-containing protein/HAMP domain-containing protein